MPNRPDSIKVRITISRAGSVVKTATPNVTDMNTAYSTAKKLKEKYDGDTYHVMPIVQELN